MATERYVVLGLGQPRSEWFREVAAWSTSGALPVEFSKCISISEVRQRLASTQAFSALLVDSSTPGVDRELLYSATQAGCPAIVIDTRHNRASNWKELGATAVVLSPLSPSALLGALRTHAIAISQHANVFPLPHQQASEDTPTNTGRLLAVWGPGGTGASTVSIALAQGFADDVVETGLVVLADLVRNAEQAMLHDSTDIMPGIEELVDAHRHRRPAVDEIHELTFAVPERGYRLLLGLRRAQDWSSIPPRSLEAAIRGLRRSFRTVVCDIDSDFEAEETGGSIDVEERNAMARNAIQVASAVVIVGTGGLKGTHSLARTIRSVLAAGVEQPRLLPVVNQGPKSHRAQREISRTLGVLVFGTGHKDVDIIEPVFLAERAVDNALRDGTRLPKAFTAPLIEATQRVLRCVGQQDHKIGGDSAVVAPGSLGFAGHAVNS